MSQARRARKAKQAQRARKAKRIHRDERRANKREQHCTIAMTLPEAIRSSLDGGHPVGLLSVASLEIYLAKPERRVPSERDQSSTNFLDEVLIVLIREPSRESTALLAAVGELLVDEPAAQLRCRRAVAERGAQIPRWIAALPQAEPYRAVRRTNVFGDVDEILVGVRLADGHELTVAVQIDHNLWSSVAEGYPMPTPIDEVLATAKFSSDTTVFEMPVADARAWIEDALALPTLARVTDTWPMSRPLVQWLMDRLPEGGERRPPVSDWESNEDLCDEFFETSAAAPFRESGHRDMLLELLEVGAGDPLRWSPARIERAIGIAAYRDGATPLEVLLDAPDLLRAFIPYAHAQSGIREGWTSGTLAKIDALRLRYKREVLRDAAKYWGLDDAV